MIATATHDTKRGEDGRARLLSLTEMPQRWAEASSRWHALSSELAPDRTRPDANDRQFILQQILASWPVELLESDDAPQLDAFRERMQVNGELIPESSVEALLPKLFSLCEKHGIPATFFELTTILAFWHFAEQNADVVRREGFLRSQLIRLHLTRKHPLTRYHQRRWF